MTFLKLRNNGRHGARSAARRWWLAVALMCAFCGQTLGFMHGVVHAFHADEQQIQEVGGQALLAHGSDASQHLEHPLEALFAHDTGALECLAFDALGQQGPAFTSPDFAPPRLPETGLQRLLTGACIARWAAFFEARGPPSSH